MTEVVIIPKEEYQELTGKVDRIIEMLDSKMKQEIITKWLDIPETCKALRVSIRTLASYRAKGMLSYSQIENKIYFSTSDIEAFLTKHYVPSFTSKTNTKWSK
ncbi:MAG: helix-turn-helix domain-containing protein [Bacteroidales bacterium]